jgi:hypothetical protein
MLPPDGTRPLFGVLGARGALGSTVAGWPVCRRDLGEGKGRERIEDQRVHHASNLVEPRVRRRRAGKDRTYAPSNASTKRTMTVTSFFFFWFLWVG